MDDKTRFERERRKRNIALSLALAGFALLVFLMSIVKWNGHFFH